MAKNSRLGLGFVIVMLLIAGVSYWVVRERSQSTAPTRNVAEAPAPAVQRPAESSVPNSQQGPNATSSAPGQTPAPPGENTPPAREGISTAKSTAERQSAAPPVQNSTPTQEQGASEQSSSTPPPAPSSKALAVAMPAEDKMTAENRRQVQQALQRRGFYQGALDGVFGPATRSAIRRFQESIGANRTGRLTETEASRLVSGT